MGLRLGLVLEGVRDRAVVGGTVELVTVLVEVPAIDDIVVEELEEEGECCVVVVVVGVTVVVVVDDIVVVVELETVAVVVGDTVVGVVCDTVVVVFLDMAILLIGSMSSRKGRSGFEVVFRPLGAASVVEVVDVSSWSMAYQVNSWFLSGAGEEESLFAEPRFCRREWRETTVPLLRMMEGGEAGRGGRVSSRTGLVSLG